MGVFNFIETFFFISLGISFVLILLLVYHFKQRLNSIENKSDTMFEIINNMVQEITIVKRICMHPDNMHFRVPLNTYPDLNIGSEMAPKGESSNIKIIDSNTVSHSIECLKPEYSEDESDEDETDDESDEDEESVEEEPEEDVDEEPKQTKIVVSDDESIQDLANLNRDVKVIHLTESTEFEYTSPEDVKTEVASTNELPVSSIPIENIVEDMDETESVIASSATHQDRPQDTRMEVYQKMSPSELKALVIQKGLSTDPSKMKKPKLLSLLESVI